MNKIHKKRLWHIILIALGLTLSTSLILFALNKNINVFLTPTELHHLTQYKDYRIRLGGMVKSGSIKRATNGLDVSFIMTDYKQDIVVNYKGILPDLFRAEKGAVAEGYFLPPNQFKAYQILAKHDENYMPKEVYKAIRERKS